MSGNEPLILYPIFEPSCRDVKHNNLLVSATLTLILSVFEGLKFDLTVMSVVPTPLAVTTPFSLTVATDSSPEDQVTDLSLTVSGFTVQVSCVASARFNASISP